MTNFRTLYRRILNRLPPRVRGLLRRLWTGPGVFATTHVLANHTHVTLYADDDCALGRLARYAPRTPLAPAARYRNVQVSLIAPVRNEATTVVRWGERVLCQTRPPDEIIVVDGGSDDGTVEALRTLAASSCIPFQVIVEPGSNIARARNLAIARARYSLIAATDFGCLLELDWLEKLIAPFEANPTTRVAAGLYCPIDRQNRPLWRGFSIHPDLNRIDPANFVPSSRSIAFTREAWAEAGQYPEWLTLTGEDTWFDRELQRAGGEWAFVPQARVAWHAPETFVEYCRKVYHWAFGDGESGLHAGFYWRYVQHLALMLAGLIGLAVLVAIGVERSPAPDALWYAGAAAITVMVVLLACRLTGVGPLILPAQACLEGVHIAGFLTGARGRAAALQRRLAATRGFFFILSGVPVDDTGGGARCTQLTLELLRRGYAVVFISRFPKYEYTDLDLKIGHPNLFTYTLAEFDWEHFEREHRPLLDAKPPAVLVEFPLPEFLRLVQALRTRRGVVVYDLLDAWDTALGGSWYTRAGEDALIAHSHVLVATAPVLAERLHARTGRPVTLLPNAVNRRLFDPARATLRPADWPKGDWAMIYTGALWGEWFDWDLLRVLAVRFPRAAVVVIGDYRGQCVAPPPNLHFLGLKAQRDLPGYLAQADVAIVPWKINAITEATSPLKVYEYLAMLKPVVAPAIAPLAGIPGVWLARTPDEFLAQVDQARTAPFPTVQAAGFAAAHDWERRVEQLVELIDRVREGSNA